MKMCMILPFAKLMHLVEFDVIMRLVAHTIYLRYGIGKQHFLAYNCFITLVCYFEPNQTAHK